MLVVGFRATTREFRRDVPRARDQAGPSTWLYDASQRSAQDITGAPRERGVDVCPHVETTARADDAVCFRDGGMGVEHVIERGHHYRVVERGACEWKMLPRCPEHPIMTSEWLERIDPNDRRARGAAVRKIGAIRPASDVDHQAAQLAELAEGSRVPSPCEPARAVRAWPLLVAHATTLLRAFPPSAIGGVAADHPEVISAAVCVKAMTLHTSGVVAK